MTFKHDPGNLQESSFSLFHDEIPQEPSLMVTRRVLELPAKTMDGLALAAEIEGCSLDSLIAAGLVAVLMRATGAESVALAMRGEVSAGVASLEVQTSSRVTFRWLLEALLSAQPAPAERSRVGFGGMTGQLSADRAVFDIQFFLGEGARGSQLVAQYNPSLFAPSSVDRWLRWWRDLLAIMAQNMNARCEDPSLISEDERVLLSKVWAVHRRDYPRDATLGQFFREVAQRFPGNVAICCGDNRITYQELELRSNGLAGLLRRVGVRNGDVVGIEAERRIEAYVAMLAIVKAGAMFLPLDPQHPDDRLRQMLGESRAAALVGTSEFAERLAFKGKLIDFVSPGEEGPLGEVSPLSPACVMFTSGSTGRPKGVVVPHRGIIRLVVNSDTMTVSPGDRVLQAINLSFDASFLEIWGALLNGATLVVIEPETLLSPSKFLAFVRRHRVQIAVLPASTFHLLADEVPEAFRGLDFLMVGGDVLDPKRVRSLFNDNVPQCLLNGYGPTENTTNSTAHRIAAPPTPGRPIPIGRPVANSTCYVLDERMRLASLGAPGELYVGGDGLALGYLHQPELTAEHFVPHPFVEGERLYRTGDRARWRADGTLEFLGRRDNQIKLRGFRIELEEVEARMLALPGVRQAAVVVREGHEGRLLVGYVSFDRQATTSEIDLRAVLRKALPAYMVPSAIIVLDQLPLTPNGKIDRRALPEPTIIDGQDMHASPRTPTEQRVAEIFADLLRVNHVGVEERFYDLGGDSLLAVKLLARVRDIFGVELAGRVVFESPSVARIAALIDNPTSSAWVTALSALPRDPSRSEGPLSLFQQPLWALCQQSPHSPAYNESVIIRFGKRIDEGALGRALSWMVERHGILRTAFPLGETPCQRVQDISLRLALVELGGADAEEAFRSSCREQAAEPFDLARAPLLRSSLFRFHGEDRLVLTAHHLILDGVSLYDVFLPELAAAYGAFVEGQTPALAPATQYLDFSVWQRRRFDEEGWLSSQIEYWLRTLADAPMLELPTDRPRPPVQAFRGGKMRVLLDNELLLGLKALSVAEGVTPFTIFLSAFVVLLHRYSGQDDVVFGTMLADRRAPGAQTMLGYFVNPLVLRADMTGNPTFREVIERMSDILRSSLARQDTPFEMLVRKLKPTRSRSYNPIFQVAFVFESKLVSLPPDWEVDQHGIDNSTSKFDLTFSLDERGDGASLQIEFDENLFEPETISAMAEHYRRILQGTSHNPEIRVGELSLLDDKSRADVLRWGRKRQEVDGEICVHRLFERQASLTPDAIALCVGEHTMTYRELDLRANRLARLLRQQGVGRNMLVGLFVERGFELIVGLLAILKAGGAYVPMDPDYPQARIAYMLSDSRASLVVSQRSVQSQLPPTDARVLYVDDPIDDSIEDTPPPVASDPGDLIYVIYTSGSTGNPKGAMLSHRNVVRLFRATDAWFGFNAQDSWTLFHSYAFDFSVWEIWGALLYGGRLVIVPYLTSRSPEAFLALLEQQGVTVLNQTPSAFRQLLGAEEARPQPANLSLRYVIFGGEALDFGSLGPWYERHPDNAPLLVNMYGITETTVHVTYRPLSRQDLAVPFSSRVGVPIPDLGVVILDKYMQPTPIGVPGEMFVAGAGVGLGYLHREELTAQRFVANPFDENPSARLYRSGDRARLLRSGDIEYLGRLDDQIKIRGFRIELGEISAAMSQHPDLREALAIVREDTPGDRRIVGYYVCHESAAPTQAELRGFLKGRLPDYMVPTTFIRLPAIPLTSNGKVNRRALPSPDPMAIVGAQATPPTSPTEHFLVSLWGKLLAISGVGIHDDFFSLGGNSLLAAQVLTRIREHFRIEATHSSYLLTRFLSQPTIAQLAQVIDRLVEDLVPNSISPRPSASISTFPSRMPEIDYEAEAVLHKAIKFQAPLSDRIREPATILLTGATGFLGAFLLDELLRRTKAEIYCLVRSADLESARRKLARGMSQMGLGDGKPNPRVVPLLGELSQPLLGLPLDRFEELARSVDVIFHNGATVNFIYPYQALKSPNVRGTQEIIRLAALFKRKPVHYISSLSVMAPFGLEGYREVSEDEPLAFPHRLHMGYLETKWVAERMLMSARDRGLPVNIFRPKDISGHSTRGQWKPEAFMCSYIKSFVEMGVAPDSPVMLDFIPADFVARAIVHTSLHFPMANQAYHLSNAKYRLMQAAVDRLNARGFNIPVEEHRRWVQDLVVFSNRNPTSPIVPFVPIFVETMPGEGITLPEMYYEGRLPIFNTKNLDQALLGTDISCPPVSDTMLDLYLDYFQRIGYIPSP